MHPDTHNKNKGYLKRRILIPLAVVILITVAVFSAATVWHVLTAIDREAESQVDFARKTYQKDIQGDAQQMAALLEIITDDDAIRRAFVEQDREALLRLARPYYRSLNRELHITHFYFTRPDRVNLLRVHNPPRNGDRIDRYTTMEAERRGELSYGLELGVLGTFTLRVVQPWFHQGKLIGYVELGEEIDHIVDSLRQTLDLGLFVFINKKHLDREEWQNGMRMLGRESEWSHYPGHILVSAPIQRAAIPSELESQLKRSEQIALNHTFDVSIPQERYKATFIPLRDVRHERVGMLLLMSPTEHWFTYGRNTVIGASLFFLLIGGGVFIMFFRLAGNTERELDKTRQQVVEEAREKERLQARHISELQQRNRLLEKARSEIQANRDRLTEAQRIAHIGSWEWDITNGTLNWSDEVYRIFGYRPGEIEATYSAFLQAVHPDHRETVEQAVRNSVEQGAPYEVEHAIIRQDGSEHYVREVGEVIYDDQRNPLRMLGTVHDITKRKRAEQVNRQLGHIFDNASNEIYLIEPENLQIIEANHTAEQRLDYASATLRRLSYLEVATDLTSERFTALTEPLRDGSNREVRFEAIHRSKNGDSYPVEVRLQYSDIDNRNLYIAMVLDISERLEQQLALQHQAMYDKLTDLPNRYLLAEQLQRELARAQREQYSLTLMQLNISGFGEINDTLGHDNGDELLRQLSRRLKEMVRQSDFVARIGGDEFALMLPESGMDEVDTVLAHLQKTLNRPFSIGDYSLNIETATGVAVYPDHADSARELMQHSDVALKRAKNFHSMTEIYRTDFDPFSVRRLVLNSEMRLAIEKREFELYFQPKVSSDNHEIHEAEALIRWHHPQHGFISPGEFIPLAEKNGFIKKITLWVIDEACRLQSEWREQGLSMRVSVNLSARNLQDPQLVRYIIDTTEKYDTEAGQLAFEVTETAVMADPEYTRTLLLELDSMGHPIAIDDYGTGYSSLAYIHRLPADELKIDSSFILNMLESEDSALIVRSTIELAHNLGMRVTAEGVETAMLAEILTNLDCDLLQGFHFSRPVPAEEFAALLRADDARATSNTISFPQK
jgi:diguanylate cyclase (GGDEF)-like protein/PAS domain S-box-containing protein